MTGTPYTGRGAGGPSIDQVLAAGMRRQVALPIRCRSALPGIARRERSSQHELGGLRPRAAAGDDSAEPLRPAVRRAERGLGEAQEERARPGPRGSGDLQPTLGQPDRHRLDEHLTSVRDLERAIASLPPDYGKNIKEPEDITDLTDYPRIAKIQSDLLVHALRVGPDARGVVHVDEVPEPDAVSVARTTRGTATTTTRTPTRDSPEAQRIMRDICRWHVEEFAYLLKRMKVDTGRRRQPARQHLRASSCTSTPRRIRTRTTAWR